MKSGLIKKLGTGIALFGLTVGTANALDTLKIYNRTDNSSGGECRIFHLDGASEGLDGSDNTVFPLPPTGYTGLYSNVQGTLVNKDYRPLNSSSTINLESYFNGDAGANKPNWNHLEFGTETFGNKTITLQQDNPNDPNATYPVYDIRKEIYWPPLKITF